jgi:integrase
MARTARPWYFTEKKAYAATVKGRRVILLKGDNNPTNEKLAAKKLRQVLKGSQNDPATGQLRVADVIERYLKLHQSKYSERAFEERKRYLQLFAEAHGWRKVNDRDCLPVHVEEWLAEHPLWRSDWTKGQIVSIVMRPFNWAAKKRLIPSNPFRGVEKSQGPPRRPMTDAEFAAVLRHASVWKTRKWAEGRYPSGRKVCPSDRKKRVRPSSAARFRQVLVFLRFTGCRPGEAVRLRWQDIDLDARELVLRRHKTGKKTRKPRRVPLHPVVLKLLIFLRRLDQPGEHVFLTHRKTPWHRVSLAQRLRRVREAAGVAEDAKLYGLRHRFGTMAILNGVDLKTLAQLLGHATVRMAEHYVALAGQRQHLADAMLKVHGHSTPHAAGPRPGSQTQSERP